MSEARRKWRIGKDDWKSETGKSGFPEFACVLAYSMWSRVYNKELLPNFPGSNLFSVFVCDFGKC